MVLRNTAWFRAAALGILIVLSCLQHTRAEGIAADDSSPATLPPTRQDVDDPPIGQAAAHLGEVGQYLWEVYKRAPIKSDRTGNFTWKDPEAAKRLGMSTPEYVIGGMDADFREQLYHAGKAMDEAGIKWTILSAFRDDYRQSLAAGYRAGVRNSLHGGSVRTGGYGRGRAVDVASENDDVESVWKWFDAHGARFGLHRPMKVADAGHVQPQGAWRKIAAELRTARVASAQLNPRAKPPARKIKRFASVSR